MLQTNFIELAKQIAMHTLLLRHDLFQFLDNVAASGESVIPITLMNGRFWLVNHPDWVRQVLTADEAQMGKPEFLLQSNRGWHGDALNTLQGEPWQTRRLACGRALGAGMLQKMLGETRRVTAQMIAVLPQESPVELSGRLLKLVISISLRWILKDDIEEQGGKVPWGEALGAWHCLDSQGMARELMPQRRMRAQDTPVLRRLIHQKWAAQNPDDGLIGTLAQNCQAQGLTLTDEQVFDELVQWLFASHHSVTTTLINCIDRICRDASIAAQVKQCAQANDGDNERANESDNDDNGGECTYSKYTAHLLQEVMRLCMPTPLLFRQTAAPIKLASHSIAAGELIVISPYLLHRDALWFPEPQRFLPARFQAPVNGYAYLPFGAGHRRCIAHRVALMQMKSIIESLVQACDLQALTTLPENLFSQSYPGRDYLVLVHPQN